ncbi:hypothetical protein JCM11491_004609 [Sporobolomyces phaffii]
MTRHHDHDVIIIGAGLSALQAARTLLSRAQVDVVLLEARNRIGGRALTDYSHSHSGVAVDLGCSMIHGYYEGNPARDLVSDLGIDVHIPSSDDPNGLVLARDGPLTRADATSLFAASTQMAFRPEPKTHKTQSVAAALFPTLVAKDERLVAIARTAEVGAGIPLELTSAKWTGFEQGVHGTDAFPDGGYSRVVDRLAEEVQANGGRIRLDTPVVAVEDLGPDGGGIRVTTRDGETRTARRVLSTIPLSVLQKSPPRFTPSLSPAFLAAARRTVVGNLEKVVLTYPHAWWPNPTAHGSYLLLPVATDPAPAPDSLERLFEQTTIPVVNFCRIAKSPHPTLLAYLGATAAVHLAKYSPEEISTALDAYLVRRLVPGTTTTTTRTRTVPEPVHTAVTTWHSDPYSQGATSSPTTVASTDDDEDEEATPLDFITLSRPEWDARLLFAGEHTDLDNHGSVAGALISGKREADRIRCLLEAEDRLRQANST